ncbi:hypothetical protein BaRGS_00001551 [Batillaria attramentaria]|uniref:Uncharacterized protein n=1 Tax=Batillaria attramentaria TaxID=370345 RepID=A0ABD0M8C9_9CAEN
MCAQHRSLELEEQNPGLFDNQRLATDKHQTSTRQAPPAVLQTSLSTLSSHADTVAPVCAGQVTAQREAPLTATQVARWVPYPADSRSVTSELPAPHCGTRGERALSLGADHWFIRHRYSASALDRVQVYHDTVLPWSLKRMTSGLIALVRFVFA